MEAVNAAVADLDVRADTPDLGLLERGAELEALERRRGPRGRRAAARSSCSRPRPASARPRCSITPRRLAADAGWQVRRAAPGPLERHFPFGVVRALLEAPLRDASDPRAPARRAPRGPAARLLLEGTAPAGSRLGDV